MARVNRTEEVWLKSVWETIGRRDKPCSVCFCTSTDI